MEKGFYKSLCEHTVCVELFGIGEVKVPPEAACIELPAAAAEVINSMAFPVVILERTEPKITEDVLASTKCSTKRATSRAKAEPVEEPLDGQVDFDELTRLDDDPKEE